MGRIGNFFWRRHPDSNRGITVLQTAALPLGYAAGKRDGYTIPPLSCQAHIKSNEHAAPVWRAAGPTSKHPKPPLLRPSTVTAIFIDGLGGGRPRRVVAHPGCVDYSFPWILSPDQPPGNSRRFRGRERPGGWGKNHRPGRSRLFGELLEPVPIRFVRLGGAVEERKPILEIWSLFLPLGFYSAPRPQAKRLIGEWVLVVWGPSGLARIIPGGRGAFCGPREAPEPRDEPGFRFSLRSDR